MAKRIIPKNGIQENKKNFELLSCEQRILLGTHDIQLDADKRKQKERLINMLSACLHTTYKDSLQDLCIEFVNKNVPYKKITYTYKDEAEKKEVYQNRIDAFKKMQESITDTDKWIEITREIENLEFHIAAITDREKNKSKAPQE